MRYTLLHKEIMQPITGGLRVITDAAKQHNIAAVYALFSGGHDSYVAAHIASRHELFRGVIHIDTGTGIPETRQFVDDACARHGWKLHVARPVIGYESLIIRHGFPGGGGAHSFMYRYLKERPLRAVTKTIRGELGLNRERIGLVSGVRKQESQRRMMQAGLAPSVDGSKVWIPAIVNMHALQVGWYMQACSLPRSRVKDALHMSGECLCGSYARPSELTDIKMFYPDVGARIERWQELVKLAQKNQAADRAAGFSCSRTIKPDYTRWGHWDGQPPEQQHFLHMCATCEAAADPVTAGGVA